MFDVAAHPFCIQFRAIRGSSRSGRSCLNDGTLAAFAEGRLAEDAHAGIEEHLAECPHCGAVLVRAAGAERPQDGPSIHVATTQSSGGPHVSILGLIPGVQLSAGGGVGGKISPNWACLA